MIVMMEAQKSILSLFQMKNLIEESQCLKYIESFSDDDYKYPNVDVVMKHSQYNIQKNRDRIYIIYNTLFNSMITLSDTEFIQYEKLEFNDLDIVEALVNNGFIIPVFVDEYKRYSYYKEILLNQISTPMHYTIAVTSNCNARCTYCYEEGIVKSDMSMQTAKLFVNDLLNLDKEFDISWFGGEPLLKTDLISYVSDVLNSNQKRFKAGIITNGSLLTKEMIEVKFPSWNIEWIQITIDGMVDEYLKRKRYYNSRKEIFSNIIDNIKYLIENNIFVSVRLNIDSQNIEECIRVAKYIKDEIDNSEYLSVYPAFLYGNEHSLYDENIRINCASDIYSIFPPKMDLLSFVPKVHPCFISQKYSFVIDTDGSILACDGDVGKQHTKYANLYENIDFNELKKPSNIIPDIRDLCKKCQYYPKCGGGCSNSYNNNCQYDSCFMERYKIEFLLNRLIGI